MIIPVEIEQEVDAGVVILNGACAGADQKCAGFCDVAPADAGSHQGIEHPSAAVDGEGDSAFRFGEVPFRGQQLADEDLFVGIGPADANRCEPDVGGRCEESVLLE
ncbi:MAG TPA: hypothetical protein DEW46_04635 [Verrucomicrobia bacterium]|nr:hypothetical protein [Verrucomicrobiota bacterium]